MPNYTATTTITTGRGESLSASKTGTYEEIFNVRQEVDNSDTFVDLISASDTKATSTLNDCKSLIIKNPSNTAAEIQIKTKEWTDGTPDANGGTDSMQSILLAAGEHIYLPSFRQLNFQADANSGGTAYQLTNQVPSSNMYVDSGADVDNTTGSGIVGSATNTTVYLEDGHSKYFKVGDLIRITNEIMEVTAVGTGADLANSTLTVRRGLYGSAADSGHSDDDAVLIPFFNAYHDFDKYSVAQTDAGGRFKCANFFGYGRYATAEADGIVPGSVSGKFYMAGYQELGLSGITASTKTGLVASTVYYFKIAVDGGTALELSITTDGSNGNFGGRNGLIQKMQEALDTQYYTAGHLFEKRVFVSIIAGDIRFTSGQHMSSSAIALTAGTSGSDTTTEFFAQAIGRMPIAANLEASVAAKLPEDTVIDTKTGVSMPNTSAFFYDDGHGNISGACTGSINYETGAISFINAPPNAEFVIDANYGSAHSGGSDFGASTANSLLSVGARCCNSKLNATVEVIGLK